MASTLVFALSALILAAIVFGVTHKRIGVKRALASAAITLAVLGAIFVLGIKAITYSM